MNKVVILLLLSLIFSPAFAGSALVSGGWLKEHLDEPALYILDIQAPERYRQAHVPGAVNAPYRVWRTGKRTSLPGMLPPTEQLEALLSRLGIKREHHVVITATGGRAGDMSAASRVFWTLKVVGHPQVSLLNGGVSDYANRFGGTLKARPNQATPSQYRAKPDRHLVADIGMVENAIRRGTPLLDARTLGEYLGVLTARPAERAGTLPGARHLPFDWLLDNDGRIRDKPAITILFQAAGLDVGQDGTIHFCHSGNRAALNWFVDYAILGHQDARLYDGSMGEWSTRTDLPMESRIVLPR
ncbi:MAG: sulfurtransferase [Sedimenticola sp.]|nr:sulfurtransferase [Sedimenticola sp.]